MLWIAVDARLACKTNPHRLCFQVLAELEVLKCPHAMRTSVVPSIPALVALLHRPDAILPAVRHLRRAAFDNTAAREADKGGLHVGNHFGDVASEAIRAVVPSVDREAADIVDINRSLGWQF